MHRNSVMVALLVGALGGCGSNGGSMTPPDLGGSEPMDDGAAFALAVEWTACSLITEGSDGRAECAMVDVPLHWSDPDDERISLFLKRHRGADGGGQSWFLAGGPGQTSADLEAVVEQLITVAPDRTYYLLDHRGVGRSTRLRCPSTEGAMSPNGVGLGEGEIEGCLAELRTTWTDDQLAGFSSTNAAQDLGELIAHLREADEVVTLWGGSYGTHWLERYLDRYAEQPNGVVFSAVALDVDLLSVDRYVGDLAGRWLDACEADAECGGRFAEAFEDSPRDVVTAAFSGPGAELCPELAELELTVDILKPFFGQLFNDRQGRSLFAPIAYRMARCAPEDVAAITRLVAALTPPDGPPPAPFGIREWGFVLSENIAVSELTSDRPRAEVEADYVAAVAVQGPTPRLLESRERWPRYEAAPIAGSDFAGRVLLLHGEYDFLPPEVYERTVEHYERENPNAELVLLPGAPHSLESPTADGQQCGIDLALSVLLDPFVELSDCPTRIEPLAFAPTPQISLAVFGTTDPWDGVPIGSDARGLLPPAGAPAPPPVVRWSVLTLADGAPFAPRGGLPSVRPGSL